MAQSKNQIINAMLTAGTAPISVMEGLIYQETLLFLLSSDPYSTYGIKLEKSLGGFFHINSIRTALNMQTGLLFHYCLDKSNAIMLAAMQGGPDIKMDDPITDIPGAGTLYTSTNLFFDAMGNVGVFNYLPYSKNLSLSPGTSTNVHSWFFQRTPIRINSDTTVTSSDVKKWREDFRRDMHQANPSLYTVTWFDKIKINELIGQPDCVGIRYYFGYSEHEDFVNNPFRIFLTAVDSNGDDIVLLHRSAGSPNEFVEAKILERSHP